MNKNKEKRLLKIFIALKIGFSCNPDSGIIKTPTGIVASAKTTNGYIKLTLREKGRKPMYLYGHQLVYYIHHKKVVDCIDHINGIKTDNRICNLREVNKSINALNSKKSKNAYYCKRSKKYIPNVMINGRLKWIGSYDSFKSAKTASINFKNKYIYATTG